MRKAWLGILMAATAAMPVAAQAQDGDEFAERRAEARAERAQERYRAAGERNQQRSERRQEAQAQRVERQQLRQEAQAQRVERQEAAPRQYQRSEQPSGQQRSWDGRRGGDGPRSERWGGRNGQDEARREAYQRQLEASREASRRGIAESIGGNYARQGQRNQERYERQLREEYGVRERDRRGGDWNRGDRDGHWGDRRGGDWNRGDRDGRNDRWGDRRGGDWNRWDRDGRSDRWSNRDSRRSSWNRDWRRDHRYDWQRYRHSNRNLFRRGGYYSPYRGYNYNRLSIGLILDSLFYSNRYWIADPWQYRLPPAPYGTQWVRYYDDVVLVDVYTGEVLDVIYDFFW
ncbi:MAG TPA: RcnB family protein [Allosphingosinicella sp.]|nr:RcnB family protein [Allosphingosinicella sp.]